ncbi:MAG: GatB/YqeY domain-containing protein [Lactobacillaceae bacterium]|nr:GatB/YqeY domain-containing protein [Lactobacillaceae bacterium]
MTLKEQLNEDMKAAMKAKDKDTLAVIRMVKAAISNKEIEDGELDDTAVLGILAKEVKQRQDTLNEVSKAGRDDLVEQNQKEIGILQGYLPEQLSDEELRQIIEKAVSDSGASSLADMGKVMGIVQPEIKGRADGSKASQIVKEILSK